MKYLREFVKKNSAENFDILIAHSFSDTEKDLLLHYRQDTQDEADSYIANKLEIKISTLKKSQSKLLKEAIEILSSDHIMDQMAFLSHVNCHRILLHFAKKKITQLKKENNIELLAKLYLNIPYHLLSSVITDYNIKDLKKFREEYKKLKPGLSFDSVKQEILVYILEFMQFNKITAKEEKLFKEHCLIIDTLDNKELEFWKNKLIGDYYHFTDEEKFLDIVKKNFDLVNKNEFNFNKKLIVNSKLQYCFYLISKNEFQETYSFFHQLIKEYPDELGFGKGLRYVDLISQVCIVLGKYEEAKKWIFSAYPIEDEEPGKFAEMYFGNTTILALIDILEDNLEKAYKKISVAKIGLKKQYFIFLDALLRIVEQAYYLKMEDFDFADSLYQKNLKFYQYHQVEDLKVMEGAHKILSAYAKQAFDKKPLSDKVRNYQDELNSGDFAFVGHFIEKLQK